MRNNATAHGVKRGMIRAVAAGVCVVSAVTGNAQSGVANALPDVSDEADQRALLGMEYADAQRCFIISGDEVLPVLPLLVSSDGLPGIEPRYVRDALDEALARGCDINQPDVLGLSPLNTAIIQRNTALVRYFIERGADPALQISSSHEQLNGLDTSALIAFLAQRMPDEQAVWQELQGIVTQVSPNSATGED